MELTISKIFLFCAILGACAHLGSRPLRAPAAVTSNPDCTALLRVIISTKPNEVLFANRIVQINRELQEVLPGGKFIWDGVRNKFKILTSDPGDQIYIALSFKEDSKEFEFLKQSLSESLTEQQLQEYSEPMIWIEMISVSSKGNTQGDMGWNTQLFSTGNADPLRGKGLSKFLYEGVAALSDYWKVNNIGSKINFANAVWFRDSYLASGDLSHAFKSISYASTLERHGFIPRIDLSYVHPAFLQDPHNIDFAYPRVLFRRSRFDH